jgi:rabenosyn-5
VNGSAAPPPPLRPSGPVVMSAPTVPQMPMDAEKVFKPISSFINNITSASPRPASVIEAFRPRHSPAPSLSDTRSETPPSLPTSPFRTSHEETVTTESEKVSVTDDAEVLGQPTQTLSLEVDEGDTAKPTSPEIDVQLLPTPPPEADGHDKLLPPPPSDQPSPQSEPDDPSPLLPSPAPSVPEKPLPLPLPEQVSAEKQSSQPAKLNTESTSTPSPPSSPSRRTSTFRRVPLNPNARSPLPSSPLRPASALPSSPLRPPGAGSQSRLPSSSSVRQFDQPARPTQPRSRLASSSSVASSIVPSGASSPAPTSVSSAPYQPRSRPQSAEFHPPPRTVSLSVPQLAPSRSTLGGPSPSAASTPSSTPAPALPPSTGAPPPSTGAASSPAPAPLSRASSSRPQAPYRPGFQPKGVYRPLTDDFLAARKRARDVGRIDRTRLERRLEKLVALHFPPDGGSGADPTSMKEARPAPARRQSSLFEGGFAELPGGLWRGLLQSEKARARSDVRSAEQRITPWAPDAAAAACPLCAAPFHPLTNRKHHCRLCGQLVCALPARAPQRPAPCSGLFVADPGTGRIEEVGEGVDYGVRRRTASMGAPQAGASAGRGGGMPDEEKFLKGVRICRECRPVLLRQQYRQEMDEVPMLAKLYEVWLLSILVRA